MSSPVTLGTHGRIALATVDHPPVNALSHAVRAGLWEAVERLDADASLDALVIVCAGKTFFSGADIKEFGKPMQEPQLPAVIERLEAAGKPVIAAIHGKALGGGLELALACHYRVALGSARVGLPEVKLGLVPGAGGTQRLPRLVGLAAAIPMVTEGTELGAARAQELGVIDAVLDDDLAAGAIAFTEALLARGAGPRRSGELPPPERDEALLEEARKTLARKKRGHRAPQAGVDALCLMWEHPFAEACRRENALCHELMQGSQSKALRHLFAAEREVARLPTLAGATPATVATVGVVGPGTMGLGIAQAC
ncbi:MAG: enoyl-CoA hydratase-related protein, partial [Gammaproteobacteria bacterium]